MAAAIAYFRERPRVTKSLQAVLVLATIGFCVWGVRDEWSKAGPRLADANIVDLVIAFACIAAYYLVFILGWIRMLAAWEIKISYRVALQAEMVSMLAKYLPGGVWTPAARTVALRRNAGVTETPTVLASILVEAALSAISGVIVFIASLAWVRGVDAPWPLLVAFGLLLTAAIHPRIFRPLSAKILKPFGASVDVDQAAVALEDGEDPEVRTGGDRLEERFDPPGELRLGEGLPEYLQGQQESVQRGFLAVGSVGPVPQANRRRGRAGRGA